MEISDDNLCFVCGELNADGLHTRPTIDLLEKSAHCRLAVPKKYQGWQGIVHGGILATLLDETCAYAAKAVVKHVVTAELTVTYKKPVPVETELLITAQVASERRRIIEVTGRIEVAGEIHAEAHARMFIMPED